MNEEYYQDNYSWLMRMAKLIKEKDFDGISKINIHFISEEMESKARMVKNELDDLIEYLIAFFLIFQHKCKYNDGWLTYALIEAKRSEINIILNKNKSLENYISDNENLNSMYSIAKLIAARLSDKDESIYPEKCPFNLKFLLDAKLL